MKKNIHILDYGLGNLFSISNAIRQIGYEPIIAAKPEDFRFADFLILPGVGSFQKGMNLFKEKNFLEAVLSHAQEGKIILGICLGMQMLFESSEENGLCEGVGLIPGQVKKITDRTSNIKVPHIGWSLLKSTQEILKPVVDNKFMYFVHSYHPILESKYCLATADYQGIAINSLVNKDNVWGCQFHPEKSSQAGIHLLAHLLGK